MLTLPKSLDSTILAIDKPSDPAIKPSMRWTSPREFVSRASILARKNAIFAPPLFRFPKTSPDMELTTHNALTPNALSWSITLMRRMGHEIELFDSIYGACNHYESNGACDQPNVKDMVMFHVARCMAIARNCKLDERDTWSNGLFEDFDFHIASAILAFRHHVFIDDVLGTASNASKNAYLAITRRNNWTPSDFVNDAAQRLSLPDSGDYMKLFSAGSEPRLSGVGDEYRALVAIIDREARAEQRIMAPSEFERHALGITLAADQNDMTERKSVYA